MSEQKNAFFGEDGFFFAEWLPLGCPNDIVVSTKYAKQEIANIYKETINFEI